MKILLIAAIILLLPGLFWFSSWILMIIWNWIMAGVFGLPVLTIWTAMGVNLLLTIIGSYFKSSSK